MFRPGSGRPEDTESESDWDTTEFPTPRDIANSETARSNASKDLHDPPTPRTRLSLSGDGTPNSGREEETPPTSARRDIRKMPTASSALRLQQPAGERGSRNPSPVPPFTTGFHDAIKNGDDISKGGTPSPTRKDNKGSRYEPSSTPRSTAVPADADMVPNWDDSDAEQQTLRELHTTFKKEKTREIESETARRQVQDEGDQGSMGSIGGRNTSVLEKWMQGREEKKKQKNVQGASQERKKGTSALPKQWARGTELAIPEGVNAPYQSFIVKDQDGKRFVYFFNEGCTSFYEVEDDTSEAVMPKVAAKVEGFIQRGWQEFFGVLRIVTSVVIFLVVEAIHYFTDYVARPLLLAVVMKIGNYLVKPVLAGLFNLVLQPIFIFLWNALSGVRHASQPLIDILGSVIGKFAILLQAFRLVEVNWHRRDDDRQSLRVVGLGRGARSDSEIV